MIKIDIHWVYSLMVKHTAHNGKAIGSNPVTPNFNTKK